LVNENYSVWSLLNWRLNKQLFDWSSDLLDIWVDFIFYKQIFKLLKGGAISDGRTTSFCDNRLVSGQNVYDKNTENLESTQFLFKKQFERSELVPASLARRLIRTKRILVLPAHINITVLTNSYDVVHSWFIPGLGLKLDCVPGRSTHHTLYIDNVGFYYGQCAEICGRYHHHMPITVCALPFEQFVCWWKKRGVNRLV
jgi:heme/copper-type cytochrome/quinol oxidase subunit 2